MVKYANNWGGLTPENNKYINDKYERFVPWSGKASTVGGEIVRAISRICYRFYNDGDTVAKYYGSEYNHNWACDSYLTERVEGYRCMKCVSFDDFEDRLAYNFNLIAEFLKKHEELFAKPNEVDCLDGAPLQRWEDEDDWDDDDDYIEDDDDDEDDD